MALQENRNINRITIVGGGTSGYLTAFYLSKTYPAKTITWIYPEVNEPIGVGEALIPDVSHFLNDLGISHSDVILHCNGTLKVGIKFEDFNAPGESFTFPFGIGEGIKHNSASIDRIMKVDTVPDDMLEYSDISVHFRASELLAYMDTLVPAIPNLKVERRTATLEELAGTYDLLIDSTGFRRRIANWPDNFVSIADRVPNNSALVFRHKYTDMPAQCKPYSIFKAMNYGWIWNIPLGDQLAVGYVHDNKFDAMPEFLEYIKHKFGLDVTADQIGRVAMQTGRNKVHLKDNVVAIGLASAFIEPIESTGLYLVTSALKKLAQYIDGTLDEEVYNQSINDEFDAVTNFIIAHYKYSSRTNEYWDHYKDIPVEDHKELDIFPAEAWDYVLAGFRDDVVRPADTIDPKDLIGIAKGTPYYKWIKDESNFK